MDATTHGTPAARPPKENSLQLHALSYDGRAGVLAGLLDSVDRAGGWVLERQASSAHALILWIEMQSRVLMDMYAAIAGSDVHLTRESHHALTERCNCLQTSLLPQRMSSILTIRLEIAFVSDTLLHSEWLRGPAASVASA